MGHRRQRKQTNKDQQYLEEVLRRIFDLKQTTENNEYERGINVELREMFNESDTIMNKCCKKSKSRQDMGEEQKI